MLEGFEPTVLTSAPKGGRPARLPSSRLRNLAWLRHLLDSLDSVRAWSRPASDKHGDGRVENTPTPQSDAPPGWLERPTDAALLKQAFSIKGGDLPSDKLRRSPALLDDFLGPMFAGSEGGGGRYFSDRILRGLASPDVGRLHRLNDLVPGSRGAFEEVPAGVDPWFYDALDFTNPWFAKMFLWRAMDPTLEDPGWDALLESNNGTNPPRFADAVGHLRFAPYVVSAADTHAFESLIEHAAALTAYPSAAHAPVEEHRAAIASVVETAAGSDGAATGALTEAVICMGPERQWMALSNAIAARRLSVALGVSRELTTWWLGTVQGSLTETFRTLEEKRYASAPRGLSAVDAVVDDLRCVVL